ncbi:unnamed protein product [Coccothraustes coccothraustes]
MAAMLKLWAALLLAGLAGSLATARPVEEDGLLAELGNLLDPDEGPLDLLDPNEKPQELLGLLDPEEEFPELEEPNEEPEKPQELLGLLLDPEEEPQEVEDLEVSSERSPRAGDGSRSSR